MPTISEIQSALDAARDEYAKIVHEKPAAEVKAASAKIRELGKLLSDTITEGANPCPFCGQPPHGMLQPNKNAAGSVTFEVGCTGCPPFVHKDGSVRNVAVVGGLLPKHAVEAWNEGVDHFKRAKEEHHAAAHKRHAEKKARAEAAKQAEST